MSRWYLTSFLVIALASAIVAFEYWQSHSAPGAILSEASIASPNSLLPAPDGTANSAPKTEHVHVAEQPLDNEAEESAEVMELWQVLDEVPANAPKIRQDLPEKHLVRLAPEVLGNLSQGSRVPVVIPGLNDPIEVAVTSVETLASGNTSILGKVNDNPMLDFVATVSEGATYATIGTELGVYNLRGNGELAWIAPGRAFNHHVDPSIPDYVIPEKPVPTPIGE